ncbi:MAG: nuclease-like protein [Ramlibacter sp.]|jgi:micrococcal nuclease|nr:nuclease-like protein [Ramlibacter sp.]
MKRFFRLAAAALLAATALCVHAGSFVGTVTHVTDGDSLWVRPAAGGPPRQVRVQGIDAPEICQAWGRESREALAAQVLHRQVRVNSRGRDTYSRTLAQVSFGNQDVGAWMVGRGHAWSYRFRRDAGPYSQQESQARSARLGLWSASAPIEPRVFRKRHGSCK